MKTYVHKKGIFSVFAIAAVMVAFVYIGIQWYLKNKIEDTTYEFNQATSLEEQKDRLLALQNTLVEIEPEIQKIDSYFVDPEEVIVFINDVGRNFFSDDFAKNAEFHDLFIITPPPEYRRPFTLRGVKTAKFYSLQYHRQIFPSRKCLILFREYADLL